MKSSSATVKRNASNKKSVKGVARKSSGNSSKSVKRAKSPTYTEADADLAIYLFKNKSKKVIVKIFTIVLILGLCFTIIYPILSLVPVVFSRLEDLGNPNVIWIPEEFSLVSFKAAIRLVMPSGIWTMVRSVGYAAGIMVLQVFFSAMVGYSLARVNFWGRGFVYALVILVFLTPRQSLLLAQYINFVHFDVLGIMNLFTEAGEVNLINNPIVLPMLAVFCSGVNQSLFIFLFSQTFKSIPKEIEEAALMDGCGFYKTYFRVMVPNAIPTISTVGILSFVWNYGDTYYTNYFYSNGKFMSSLLSSTFVSANKETILYQLQVWFDVPVTTDLAFDAVKQAGVLIFLIPLLIVYLFAQRNLVENLENSGLVG